jgi:hypothetical protein
MITKSIAEPHVEQRRWKFISQDRVTGVIKVCMLGRLFEEDLKAWCPIIGLARPSIMTRVQLSFKNQPAIIRIPEPKTDTPDRLVRAPLR